MHLLGTACSTKEVAVKFQGIPKPGLGVNAIGLNHDHDNDQAT